MSRSRRASLVRFMGVLALCGFAADVRASGFALQEDTAEGMGNAFAGQTAKAYDASTVYYNAAGMSRMDGVSISGTTSWFAPSSVFHGSNSNVLYGTLGGPTVSGQEGFNNIKAADTGAAFGVYPLGPDWRLGLSVDAPFGARVEYQEGWVGRYQGLVLDLTDVEFAPAVSYRVNHHLSVGGGPRFDWIEARFGQSINSQAIGYGVAAQYAAAGQFAAAGALETAATGAADGSGWISASDLGAGYALSALYEIDDDSRIGINYRSKIFHTLNGPATFQTPGFFATLPAQVTRLVTSQTANIKVTLPDSLHVGLYHDINRQWSLLSDLSWTQWSVFRQLTATGLTNGAPLVNQAQNWHDTWAVSLGANFKPDERWTIHGGVAYDQSPVSNSYRNTLLPDSSRYWVAVGASYAVAPAATLHASYSHLFADSAPINETMNSSSGALTGSYDNSADVFSVGFDYKF